MSGKRKARSDVVDARGSSSRGRHGRETRRQPEKLSNWFEGRKPDDGEGGGGGGSRDDSIRLRDSSRSAGGGANSSRQPAGLPRKRLPRAFLPKRGRVKARPVWSNPTEPFGTVQLLRYGPDDDRGITSQGVVGRAYYKADKWREYDYVEFVNGIHYLRIRLTENEMRSSKALDRDGSRAQYGWAMFELFPPRIPDGKDYFQSQFYVYRKPTVLIGLFDGIGGGRVAMETLKDRYAVVRSFSSETDDTARAVVRKNFPDTVELGGVDMIDRRAVERRILRDGEVERIRRCATWDDEVHFVVVAGPPCQNLSQAKAADGFTEGVVNGRKSRMFFHVPRLLRYLADALGDRVGGGGEEEEEKLRRKKVVHFLVENVEMSNRDREIFREFLGGVEPWKIDFNDGGCCASLMSRRRLYWCSLMPRGGEVGLDAFKKWNCAHPALMEGKGLDDVLARHDFEGYEFCSEKTGKRVERLPTMTRFIKNKGQDKYFIRRKRSSRGEEERRGDDVRVMRAPESVNEDLLGFPVDHTRISLRGKSISEDERRKLLGNTFMVFHIKYLLKRMHEYTDLVNYCERPAAFVPMLPQDLCRHRIGSNKRNNHQRYRGILQVLDDLHFDELGLERQDTISQFLERN